MFLVFHHCPILPLVQQANAQLSSKIAIWKIVHQIADPVAYAHIILQLLLIWRWKTA